MFGYRQSFGEQDGIKTVELSINLDYLALEIKRYDEELDGEGLYRYLQDYSVYGIFRDAVDKLYTKDCR